MSSRLSAVIVDEHFPHHVDESGRGLLVGVRRGTEAIVVGYCAKILRDQESASITCDQFVRRHYPAGINVIGWWAWNTQTAPLTNEQILAIGQSHDMSRDGAVVVLLSDTGVVCYECTKEKGRMNLTDVCVRHGDVKVMVKDMVCLQLRTSVHLSLTSGGQSLSESISNLQRDVGNSVLYLPRMSKLLPGRRKGAVTLESLGKLEYPESVEMLHPLATKSSLSAPVISLTHISSTITTITLCLDIVGLFMKDSPLEYVCDGMRDKLSHQLELIRVLMEDKLSSVCVHHFIVPSQQCPVTVVYPHTPLFSTLPLIDDHHTHMRRCLHQQLCLPLSRPYLRTINLHWCQQVTGPHLLNPHVGVKTSRISGGELSMVDGSYVYHHYMQDGFNDDKWGCAYRSLQTLWSWFKLQGYTDLPPPSHQEIQRTLVELQDKEASFLGSREWIGSFEVSLVLNHHLKVESKIHYCSSGADMVTSGRVLLRHFKTHGTPVMIGGGVLAHTIVGVDFNELSGEIKFLIVDPHYTGCDDVRVVQDKGWCGWKTAQFWNPEAHYNMCLPQRPNDQI